MEKENSPKNFCTWSFRSDHALYFDDDGAISIWKMLARPVYGAGDPRHLSPQVRDRLVQYRIAQMEQEAERDIALLQSLGRD